MAAVYKRTNRKPIPNNAAITHEARAMPSGATVADCVATWTDRDGCKRTAKVKGKKIVVATAQWSDSQGTKSAPLDHTESVMLVVDDNYSADFSIGTRRVRKSTRVSDKVVAQRIANQWEADERLESEGIRDEVDAALAKYRMMPIADHIKAFIAFRATDGGTAEHRERTKKHIEEFAEAGGWATIRQIHIDDVTQHVARLKKTGMASRTVQSRLQSIKSFTKWLTDQHRIKRNPLSAVKKPNPETDRKHERRMLLPDEWTWLVAAIVDANQDRNSMTPAERLLLYQTGIQTGLRVSELHELTRGKLNLADDHPYITCKAAGTKNKKPAKQYIDTTLAADLRDHVGRKHPTAPVFGIGGKNEMSRMIELDLIDARRLWLKSLDDDARIAAEQSDFLCRTNHEGEHLVFHSLRHTCGAWLAMAGESIKVVQTVMRHSTPVLTLNTYGHLFPGQCEGAPVKLASMMAGDKTFAKSSHTSHILKA